MSCFSSDLWECWKRRRSLSSRCWVAEAGWAWLRPHLSQTTAPSGRSTTGDIMWHSVGICLKYIFIRRSLGKFKEAEAIEAQMKMKGVELRAQNHFSQYWARKWSKCRVIMKLFCQGRPQKQWCDTVSCDLKVFFVNIVNFANYEIFVSSLYLWTPVILNVMISKFSEWWLKVSWWWIKSSKYVSSVSLSTPCLWLQALTFFYVLWAVWTDLSMTHCCKQSRQILSQIFSVKFML